MRVGAHSIHVSGSPIAPPFDCDVCHVQPADALSPGHVDGATATVVFSGLAANGITPDPWNRELGTCSNAYCHGATLAGGTTMTPRWTPLDGSQAACGNVFTWTPAQCEGSFYGVPWPCACDLCHG